MSVPSKQELKEKYKISNEDFEVLTDLPSEREVREKGFLVKVGEAFGGQEWMWKTWAGIVLAVILIAPKLQSSWDFWKPKLVQTANQFSTYFRHLRWPLDPSDDQWIAFVPDLAPPPASTSFPSFRSLTVGSGLFPGSAQSGPAVPIQFVSQIRYHFRESLPDVPPGQKNVSASATERELLPLSHVVSSSSGAGRVVEGAVPHLPYNFRVSIFDPEITVEAFHEGRVLEGFPKKIRHALTSHSDSRVDFAIPIGACLKEKIEKSLLYDRCFITYVNLVLGADDGLIGSAILKSAA